MVESLIFSSPQILDLDRLVKILETPRSDVRSAVESLIEEYSKREGGIRLAEISGGYQFRTVPENAEWLRAIHGERLVKFSQAALEALAIIAYRQPITRAEIEYLRGVDSGGVLKTLLDRTLLKIVGRKDVPGRPIIYGTSKEFLEHFGLNDLSGLPNLKEFADLAISETALQPQQQMLMDDPAAESNVGPTNNRSGIDEAVVTVDSGELTESVELYDSSYLSERYETNNLNNNSDLSEPEEIE